MLRIWLSAGATRRDTLRDAVFRSGEPVPTPAKLFGRVIYGRGESERGHALFERVPRSVSWTGDAGGTGDERAVLPAADAGCLDECVRLTWRQNLGDWRGQVLHRGARELILGSAWHRAAARADGA